MTVTCRLSSRGVYELDQNGIVRFIQQIYEADGFNTVNPPTNPEVIALCSAPGTLPDRLPTPGSSNQGLRQARMVVEEKITSGSQRRILVQWGRRGRGTAVTTERRITPVGSTRIQQPYIRLNAPPPGQPGPPLWINRDDRQVQRGQFDLSVGKFVDANITETSIGIRSASLTGRLYVLDGQPYLFQYAAPIRRASGELWVWTVFRTTGWVQAVQPNTYEQGQPLIAELPPLAEYDRPTPTGTPARLANQIYQAVPSGAGGLFWF